MTGREPSTALALVDTLVRPRDLDDTVEIVIAGPVSRVFPTRQSASLGVCLKLGPAHTVTANGRMTSYPANSVCVRAPGCVWSSADTGPSAFISIDIAADALPEDASSGAMSFVDAETVPDVRAAARVLLSAATRLENDEVITALVSALGEHRLVVMPALDDRNERPSRLERARQLLEDCVETNPSLDHVAQAARINKHVLVRRFRERYGTTPHAYLLMTKVDRARTLLSRGVPAGEVAMRLGFADQSHLTRAFRSLVGITPAAYQRSVRATG